MVFHHRQNSPPCPKVIRFSYLTLVFSSFVGVEVIDQYGNKTDALSAESMKAVSVSADNLDESALNFDWQVDRSKQCSILS